MIGSINASGINKVRILGGYEAYLYAASAATLGNQTTTSAGTVNIDGTSSRTLANQTLESAGTVDIDGVLDALLQDTALATTTDILVSGEVATVQDDETAAIDVLAGLLVVHATGTTTASHGGSGTLTPRNYGAALTRH